MVPSRRKTTQVEPWYYNIVANYDIKISMFVTVSVVDTTVLLIG